MKKLAAIICVIISQTLAAQCTFERFWDYYTAPPGPICRTLAMKDKGYLVYVIAESDSNTYGNGDRHLVQFKVDSCGSKIWINDSGYIGDGDPTMAALETDSDNYIMVGYTVVGLQGSLGNIRVAKHNRNGELLKVKLLNGDPVSAASGVVKNSFNTHSYIVYGYAYNVPNDTYRPLLVEIDRDLNVIRSKQFGVNESIGHLLIKDKNTFVAILSKEQGTSIIFLDSTFNIKREVSLIKDSVVNVSFYLNQLFWSNDSTNLIGSGNIEIRSNGSSSERLSLMRFDLEGNLVSSCKLSQDSFAHTDFLTPTVDGGYILGWSQILMKVDSTFQTVWVKQARARLSSAFQLSGGDLIASGISSVQIYGPEGKAFFRPYLVRMDSQGNHINTGFDVASSEVNCAVHLFPNPANSYLQIASELRYQKVKIMDMTGRIMMSSNCLNGTSFDISALCSGIYIVQLLDDKGIIIGSQKLLIQD